MEKKTGIGERYFEFQPDNTKQQKQLASICEQTGFVSQEELFRGVIYDADKVGSLIHRGEYNGEAAVLKVQFLEPEVNEPEIFENFSKQNTSDKIRVPRVYAQQDWEKDSGYGCFVMEYVDGPLIYQPPFADAAEQEEFCEFYQEYRSHCLVSPWVEQTAEVQDTLKFTKKRVNHWSDISRERGHFGELQERVLKEFLSLAEEQLSTIPMEFQHGHLTAKDIRKNDDGEYILTSNLFWTYRPKYYDASFHLWQGLCSLTEEQADPERAKAYIQNWCDTYKTLPVFQQDSDFERIFWVNMAERCVGSLLVDVVGEKTNKRQQVFAELFEYAKNQL